MSSGFLDNTVGTEEKAIATNSRQAVAPLPGNPWLNLFSG
jgi:hypothetical protein